MDKKLNQVMINGNLLCKDLTEANIQSESGFSVKKETKFKTLEVINSSSEDVKIGDVIVVPYHSGQPIDDNIIVNTQSVIYIK